MKNRFIGFLLMVALVAAILTGCGAYEWISKPDNANAMLATAQPFLMEGCTEVKIGPVYTLLVDAAGNNQIVHSGGFLIGGCGRMVELQCDVTKPPEAGPCQTLMQWVKQNDDISMLPEAWKAGDVLTLRDGG